IPLATACQPRWSAVDDEAHAFSTFTIGTPRSPVRRRTTWPRMDSWPFISPDTALPTYAACTCAGSISASLSAPATASSTRSRALRSRCLPKRVIAAPRIQTSFTLAPPSASAQRNGRQRHTVVDKEAADGVARVAGGAQLAAAHRHLELVDPGHLRSAPLEPDLFARWRFAEQIGDQRVGVALGYLAVTP